MLPYLSVSEYYKSLFGEKVYKIALDAGCTCPNRDGTKGVGGCIFCSPSGSGDFTFGSNLSIAEQIAKAKVLVSNKIKTNKFLAYFQNFTNTYGNEEELLQKYNEALAEPGIVGIIIGTRPDCISNSILSKISKIAEKTYVSIELGFQTSNENSANYIRRHFTNQDYTNAIERIKSHSSKIHIVTHIIFGLPGETQSDMLASVQFAVNAKTDGLKIALLHVLRGTDLAKDYENKKFECMSQSEYFETLKKALQIVPKNVVIHRLTGDGPKSLLIAPLWTANKKAVHNAMNKYLKILKTFCHIAFFFHIK